MIGIIGGTGVYRFPFFDKAQSKVVETPHGEATAVLGQAGGTAEAFIPRHGAAHGVPPHRVNYRANIWALKDLGAQAVIGLP